MEPLSASALKAGLPALREGFRALRRELARRPQESLAARLSNIDPLLDEAVDVLAGQADGAVQAAVIGVKGLISRPAVLSRGAPRRWIATELAQGCLKDAARAAIRGEDDTAYAERALAHYRAFLDDEPGPQPDAEDVYFAALDYILRSLKRDLTTGEALILARLDGLETALVTEPVSAAGELLDERIRALVDQLRWSRFFRSADTAGGAARLAEAIVAGPFRSASPSVKAFALAWCARVTAFTAPATARHWLAQAEALALDPSPILRVAQGLVAAADDWRRGLALLAPEHDAHQATATFQIVRHGLGHEEALAHARAAGMAMRDLDSDGRYAWIATLVETGRWAEALDATQALGSTDYIETPALMWLAASILVASQLPEELRPLVLHEVPPSPRTCPLREDRAAVAARRAARELMDALGARCDALQLPMEAAAARRYALWLRLADPADVAAIEILRERSASPSTALAHLPLALGYGLEVNPEETARRIEQRLALEGDPSPETMNALASLLVDQAVRNPVDAAVLLSTFRAQLAAYIEPRSFLGLETRILVDSGRAEEARARLKASDIELGPSERELLSSLIEGEGAAPSLDALEALYRDNPRPEVLVQLVARRSGEDFTPRYLELARTLLQEMPTTEFAVGIVGFLVAQRRDAEAAEMLALVGDLVENSPELLAHAAWLHFRRGDLSAAERLLEQLEGRCDESGDRELRLQLLIASGQWEALDGYLDKQWTNRADRSAIELARCATLAAQIGARRVIDFARAAVAAGPENPHVLLAAYMAATTAGLENDFPEATQWLMAAASHSGPGGPVQSAPLETLLEGRDAWEERTNAAQLAHVAGAAPREVIAQVVSRSWLELMLTPLVLNRAARDPRRVQLAALFSGHRRVDPGEHLAVSEIAIDASALVTLAVVDALDILERFDRVFVPHSVLGDLFEQRSRLSFHQPSRIAFSKRLLDLVSDGVLRSFEPTASPSVALVAQLGLGRAAVVAEAAAHDDGQHVYVHPYPIRAVGSLLAEPVPLDDYRAHLASCLGVIELLERAGQVTSTEAEEARAYLDQHDAPWPDEPRIEPGAVLYLSDLAIDYFRYVRLLDRIAGAGVTVVVAASKLEEARALRDAATLFEGADWIISRLRDAIKAMIADGRAVLTPAGRSDDRDEAGLQARIALVEAAPVIVSDDRFLNRHSRFDLESGSRRILASIDLLQLLANDGRLPAARLDQIAIELRRRGAAFIPLLEDNLRVEMSRTELAGDGADGASSDEKNRSDPHIRETGELRAVRENLRQIQAHGFLDPAYDTPWLFALQAAIVATIHAQFGGGVETTLARARASWLYRLLDSRAWSETQVGKGMGQLELFGSVFDHARLTSTPSGLAPAEQATFEAWLQSDVLEPMWAREPRQKKLLLDHLRGFVRAIARETAGDTEISERKAASYTFKTLPAFLQVLLLDDAAFQDEVGYTLETRMELSGASFLRADLLGHVRALYSAPDRELRITDEQGRSWSLRTDPTDSQWPLLFEHAGKTMRLRGLLGLHPDGDTRIGMLKGVLAEREIDARVLGPWREILQQRPLEPDEIEALDETLSVVPPMVAEAVEDSLESGRAAISLLVPEATAYWDHLAGPGGAPSLDEHLAAWAGPAQWSSGSPVERAAWGLLLGSHGKVSSRYLPRMDAVQWRKLGRWVISHGDVLSQTAFVEVALPHASEDPALEEQVLALAAAIEALDPADEAGPLHLFSSLAIFVEGELARADTLTASEPWHRRMAAMAHAALLARATTGRIDTARFARFGTEMRGSRFALQTLVDMRREPRWRADYMLAPQLRHEFIGRIFNAAAALSPDQLTPAIQQALLAETNSLRSRMVVPQALLPGPLEGAVNLDLQPISEVILADLEDGLAEQPIAAGTVRRLINLEGIVRLPHELCLRAEERIRADGAMLLSALPPDEVFAHLLGLANLAASHRLPELAHTVQILARLQQIRSPIELTAELQLVFHAAAAHADSAQWRTFIGTWVREIAYRISGEEDARSLLSWLDGLCEADPGLHSHTGRARAALRLMLGLDGS